MSSPMRHVPNLLSLFRIVLVPLLVVVLLTKFEGKEFVALGLFLLAALTDFLDGFIARRHESVTRLGKLLDPAADKILTSAAFISLVALRLAPAWIVMIIIAREFAVSALRSFAASDNVVISAGLAGKIKTVTQVVAISLLIVSDRLGAFHTLAPAALWVALVVSVYSAVEYFIRYTPLILARESHLPQAGTVPDRR